jgi:cation:H+ antiporter
MIWLEFIVSAALIVLAATQLAKYADALAVHTKMGGMFIGLILLAGVTSLPELLTTISSVRQGAPNLAAGGLLGSNMINMVLLAVLDLAHHNERILRKAALKHALTGSLSVFIIALVVFFIVARLNFGIGWVGMDSLTVLAVYVLAIRLIRKNSSPSAPSTEEESIEGLPGLTHSIIGFSLAAGSLVFITPWMVSTSVRIADITGLGTTFIGTSLVALVTSLPELVTTLAAVRMGADDMAIGNLFGSNMFNMFAIGFTDLVFTQGFFLSSIDSSFLLVGMLGLLMTGMGLIGNLARLERRIWFVELDAMALLVIYIFGMWLLFQRSIGI